MADDPKKTDKPDDTRINVNRDFDLQYWSSKWGCTKQDVFICVHEVGPLVKDVEACLRRKGMITR